MDPLEQIKRIIVESEEETQTAEPSEKSSRSGDTGSSKAMQMSNVEKSRAQSGPGTMPMQSAQPAVTAVGYDIIKALIDKIPQATLPQNDPKAKSSSAPLNMAAMSAGKPAPVMASTETESEEFEGNKGKPMIKEKPKAEGEEGEEGEEGKNKNEHLEALFNGEALSEDFKQKAALIFQTALAEREESLREEISAEYESLAEEYTDYMRNEINEQVDSYLGYVVKEWVDENKLQIENGVRLEIAESFISGLRSLFVEHGIDVPDSDVSLVEELADKVSELESRLNEEINRNIEMNESIQAYRRNEVVATLGEDLTSAEFERFNKLCENVSYETDEAFINKISTIKESYFGEATPASKPSVAANFLSEEFENSAPEETQETINESMDQYVKTLSRLGKK